jgi:hypothetical protein
MSRITEASCFTYVIFSIIIAALIGVGLLCQATIYNTNRETVTMLITGRERVVTEDNSYYLIFTEDPNDPTRIEVFTNQDIMIMGKFNSSDFQALMQEDKVCTFEVGGFRIPFLSSYRNIISVEGCE